MSSMQSTLGSYIDAFILTIVLYTHSSYSLYEDQIGKFDWQQQYLGYVTRTFLGKVIDGSRQIILITEQNVIASLKLESGEMTWRKLFENGIEGKIDTCTMKENKLLTMYESQTMLRLIDILSGYIVDEISLIILNENLKYKLIVNEFNDGIVIINEKFIKFYLFYPKWKEMWESPNIFEIKTTANFRVLIDKNVGTLVIMQFADNMIKSTAFDLNTGQFLTNQNIPLSFAIKKCNDAKNSLICLMDTDHDTNYVSFIVITTINKGNSYQINSRTFNYEGITSDDVIKVQILNPENNNLLVMSLQTEKFIYLLRLRISDSSHDEVELILQESLKNSIYFTGKRDNNHFLAILSKESSNNNEHLVQYYWLKNENVGKFEHRPSQDLKLQLPFNCGHIVDFKTISLDGGGAYSIYIQTSDYALMLFNPEGHLMWIREEALAYVKTAEMIDLPVADKQALSSEQGYLDSKSKHPFIPFNIASRIYYQSVEIMEESYKLLHRFQFFRDPASLVSSFTSQTSSSSVVGKRTENKHFALYYDQAGIVVSSPDIVKVPTVYRDDFNLRKLIVVSTEIGKIFGLDSKTGKIVYSFNAPKLIPFNYHGQDLSDPIVKSSFSFFLLRTCSHYPLAPKAIVVGKDKDENGGGRLICFDPINGILLEALSLPYQIKQITQLPILSQDFIKPIVLLDSLNKVHIYPSNLSEFVQEYLAHTYIFTVDDKSSSLTGYNLGHTINKADDLNAGKNANSMTSQLVWNLNLQYNNQKIVSITSKRQNEQIDSPGKVLDDRNVLYKYVNPNLVVIVTECPLELCPSGHFEIHLVDVVVGNVIYSAQHKKCQGPVHVVNSENWIFYTYYNVKQRRQEVSIIYLYQGTTLDNSTILSSFYPPLDRAPMIEHRSFIFPSFPITALTTTFTELGLTQKKLIVALGNGKLYEFSREIFDQRYSFQRSKDERVDFYVPELPFFTQQVLNYNISLKKIRGFHVSPSGLESTSLVFAYGLDLYSTRITPSNHFDALKDDFDSWIIVAVLVALIVLSLVTRILASKKELNMAWS